MERRSSRIESYEFDCLFFIWAGKWCTRVDEIRFCGRAMSQSMSDILFDELNPACHRYGVNASQEEGREGEQGEGNNYDTKDSGASMLINVLMARLIAIGCQLLLISTPSNIEKVLEHMVNSVQSNRCMVRLEMFGVSSLNEEITCKCEETCKIKQNEMNIIWCSKLKNV